MNYYNPVEILLGSGCRASLGALLKKRRCLIFISASALDRYRNDTFLNDILNNKGTNLETNFSPNPSVMELKLIAEKYSNSDIEVIVGLGGGSAMDVAKISTLAIPAYNQGIGIEGLLELQGSSNFVREIDLLQVPTTAGTGSEVTPFATVWDYQNEKKLSLSAKCLFADVAIVDPDFLESVPDSVQVSTSLDAINQAFESIWNRNANPITVSYAKEAIILSMEAMPNIGDFTSNDRLKMATASLFAGMAISQTRTALCHSISYPLTMKYQVPHGLACAFSMLEVFKLNESKIKTTLDEMSAAINFDVYTKLSDIFEKLDLETKIKLYVSDLQSIEALISQMYDVTRSSNNIVEVNNALLSEIISKSARRLNIGSRI